MENMYKGLTVPKSLLIVWPKIPQMSPNLSAQFVCPSPKVWDFDEKKLLWASIVRVFLQYAKSIRIAIFTMVEMKFIVHLWFEFFQKYAERQT